MDPTTQRDDELAQQAPLVPDIGRADDTRTDDTRTDGGRTPTGETHAERERTVTDPAIQRTYDDELIQEAPLVPDVGRRGSGRSRRDTRR